VKKIAILLVLIFPVLANAGEINKDKWWGEKWSKQDYALEATWQVIHLMDWGTTLDITRHPDQYKELNPILGEHPTREEVNLYMFSGALLHAGVTHILPPKYRPYFQGITIGMSGVCVLNNLSVGLQIKF
jgi:hypothetical protein